MPDAFITVINVYDDIEYVERTIKAVEYMIDTKCIAIIINPIKKTPSIGSMIRIDNIEGEEEYILLKHELSKKFNIPILDFSDVLSSDILSKIVVDYFSE